MYSHTVSEVTTLRPSAKASQPTIKDSSCIRDLKSRAFVKLLRSFDSLALQHGCLETWQLLGMDAMSTVAKV